MVEGARAPWNLADQLTLFKVGWVDFAPHTTASPPSPGFKKIIYTSELLTLIDVKTTYFALTEVITKTLYLNRCSTKTDQLDEHEDSNGFYGQCPSQTESKCLTEEQGLTSEEYEIRNTVRKLFNEQWF